MSNGFLNLQLLDMAEQLTKDAFVDPATMTGGGGGAPPGGDPAAMGGMPPGMDPAMMGGGGAPPAAPAGPDPTTMLPLITQAVQQAVGGAGGGAGAGAGGPMKPKIDVNVTMLQILKILARIADALGVQIPASEMVATSNDLTQFANQQATGAPGTPPQSSITPPSPIQGASPAMAGGGGGGGGGGGEKQGSAFDPALHFDVLSDKSAAMLAILAAGRKAA